MCRTPEAMERNSAPDLMTEMAHNPVMFMKMYAALPRFELLPEKSILGDMAVLVTQGGEEIPSVFDGNRWRPWA